MSRKRNRTRRPNAHANNRRGPRTVGFDGDHLMQDVDPSPTRNRNPANRRGGNNKSLPTRGRGAQPYRSGNNRAPGPRGGQAQRNNNSNASNSNPNKRKRRNNNNHNRNDPPSTSSDFDMQLSTPPPPPLPFTTSPFSSSFPSFSLTSNNDNNINNNNFNGNGGGGDRSSRTNTRFCTECSAVRRANLRFRNWAARAIRACGERFREWADDAGVGFESADEMDWQPEPVIRVLFVGPPTPLTSAPDAYYPHPYRTYPYPCPPHPYYPGQQQHKPSFGAATPYAQGLDTEPSYLEQMRQQHGGNLGIGIGGVGVGSDPKPGPWPWPPFNWYENPTVPTWSARVPSTGLPSVPTTMEDVPLPDCSSGAHTAINTNTYTNNTAYANNNNASVGGPTPVSGFGLLGAGYASCAGCAAEERRGSRLGCAWSSAGEQPPIPARAPPLAPAVTSTCGPSRVGVPSARPLGASFATYRGSRKTSRDSDGPY